MVLPGHEHSLASAPSDVVVLSTEEPAAMMPPTVGDLMLQDLETYKHCHEVFVACATVPSETGETATGLTTTVTLHSQRPVSRIVPPSESPMSSPPLSLSPPLVTLTVPLSVTALGTALAVVRGFADLGEVDLPSSADGAAATIQLYTVSVYGEYDVVEHIFSDDRVPVWKWVKPAGPYGPLRSMWETELAQVLEDGEWRGGTNLMLLVAGVSEATHQSLVGRLSSSLTVLTF